MSIGETKFGLEISKGVLAKFLMAAIGFAGSIVFARALGPAGYGAFYVVVTLVDVLNNPVTGWGVACKKRISEADFPSNEALGSGLLGSLFLPLVILPGVFLFERYTDFYDLNGLFVPFSLFFVTLCFFEATNRILSARANFSAAEWADTLRSFLTIPLQLAFVLLGAGVMGMVYGVAIATALTVPFVLWQIGIRPSLPSRVSIRSISEYAKYSIPNGFLGTAKSRIDILLLGALLTSTAVGEYQVAFQLTMPGTFIGGVASAGLMARVSESWSQENETAVVTDVTNSLGYASVLAIPILFGAIAMPNDLLVTIFGTKFEGVGPVLIGLSLFQAINLQTRQLGATIEGLNRPDVGTRVSPIVLTLNIVLGYILLLRYGVFGVVVATVVSELVNYCVVAYVVKQYLPAIRLITLPFLHQVLSGAVMYIIVDQLHAFIGVTWWGELALLVGIGGVVYTAVLVTVSEPFRTTVRGIFGDVAPF